MSFKVPKKLSLSFLGTEWSTSYINFALPSLEENLNQKTPTEEEIKADPLKHTRVMLKFAEDHFLDGKAWDGTQLVDLHVTDIKELPSSVFIESTKLLNGVVDPNS